MAKYAQTKKANCGLEKELFDQVEKTTPDYIKNVSILDLNNENEFSFRLKREHLLPYDEKSNPEGLNLTDWLKSYAKEAEVSTAGIRGPQNILYPYDTRFSISTVGIMLATLAKALVAKKRFPDKRLLKLAGREVRYNSDLFLEIIARLQAKQGIKTLVSVGKQTMPIWLASFLTFKLGLLGGEYITSSHGISVKNATKDLNFQGSQYLPEESIEFVDKIKEIFQIVEEKGYYDIEFSRYDDELIDEKIMAKFNDGVDLYNEYLKSGVAKPCNIELIQDIKNKIVIENVGGSAFRTLSKILKSLDVEKSFAWFNIEEDPFFHSIGKYSTDPKGDKCFYDYSVDATVLATDRDGNSYFPVIETMGYVEKLKNYPLLTPVLITDPDHDRLTVCQIDSIGNTEQFKKAGVDYVKLDGDRVLVVFTANQAFLMLMDFFTKQLKAQNFWQNHPRFMIKTTASAKSWDEWAKVNGVRVVNVPVGFKEIANVMKKVEKQITESPAEDVVVSDIFGERINLGKNPRLIFAGEESGGMIMGSEELIDSLDGKIAIAMREKSAAEAIFVAASMASKLEKENISFTQNLINVFEDSKIIAKYDVRVDISYYNESEPDINKLKQSKMEGEAKRTKNDLFYLGLAVSKQLGKISIEDVKKVLNETFATLDFDNLLDIKFVGDGTYLEFDDKFVEIRPSGTDAKTKAYSSGENKDLINDYAKILGNYSGELNDIYKEYVDLTLYENAKEESNKFYMDFVEKDAHFDDFQVPDYDELL